MNSQKIYNSKLDRKHRVPYNKKTPCFLFIMILRRRKKLPVDNGEEKRC